jgi:PAS domain S-box-containing protein
MMDTFTNFNTPIPAIDLDRDKEFRILVSSVKEYAIFMIDPEGLIKTWNDGAKNIKGYEADEIIGKHISVFYTKDDVEKGAVAKNLEMAKALGSFEDEGWRVKKDGTVFWADVIFTAIYNELHELTGFTKVTRDISNQKKIKDNLALEFRSAYEKLLFHVKNTPLGFIEWDNKLHIRSLSKRAEDIFGWSLQQFAENQKTGFTQVYEEDLSLATGISKQLLSGKVARNHVQHRNYTRDGKVIWCEWFNSVLKDKEGNVITIMSLVQDITERKTADEALRRSESDLKAIFENTSEGVILTDTDGILKSFNNKAKDLVFLNTEEELKIGKSLFDIIEESGKENLKQIISKVLSGETIQRDRFYKRKNGKTRWFVFTKTPVYSEDKIEGICITISDITERKQSENALRQSESRYRQIVETAQEGIWLIDKNSRTTLVNRKMCEILEYSEKEMLGKDIYYFMDDASKEAALKSMESREEGLVENLNFRYIAKSGKRIWANISVNSIFDDAGYYIGALAMVSDISEKKLMEERLLEQVIQEQKNIAKAVVNAQEKERAEIGMELHDNINQLLAASNLYLSHGLSQADHKPFILQSKEYIVKAMEEIRKLSHVLVGPAHEKTMGLIAAVEELISNISIVKEININFNYSTYDENESEIGLKTVIYRIIQEQMSNILKHAKASEVKIELKKEQNDLILVITDNGQGFDTSVKGKGIGLKNIRNRAELYDGTVKIVCPPGKGCKMKIVFKGNIN